MFAIGPCAHAQMCCPSTIDVSCDGELTADCSKCASTCLYCSGLCTGGGITPFNDSSIKDAVKAWCDDPHSAAGVYGNISAWDTSEVTDMSYLFNGVSTFDQALKWDTNKVTEFKQFRRCEKLIPKNDKCVD